MNVTEAETIVIVMRSVPIRMDRLHVLATLDIVEMVLRVKVSVYFYNYFTYTIGPLFLQ